MAIVDLRNLKVGDQITATFVVSKYQMGETSGTPPKPMLTLGIRNATGGLEGKIWAGQIARFAGIKAGDAIYVHARVKEYRGEKELDFQQVTKASDDHPVRAYLNDVCPTAPSELQERFNSLRAQIRNPGYAMFLDLFFSEVYPFERFATAPGAINKHHAYIHGLFQHSIEVARIGVSIAAAFDEPCNTDAIIVGGLLHDIGKLEEHCWEGVPIGMTPRGRFTNHIALGPAIFERVWTRHAEALMEAGLSESGFCELQNITVSHHGTKEWGSPQEPISPASMAIHLADLASARMRPMLDVIRTGTPDEHGWILGKKAFPFGLYAGPVVEDESDNAVDALIASVEGQEDDAPI